MKFKVGDQVIWWVAEDVIADLCRILECYENSYRVKIIASSEAGLEGREHGARERHLHKYNLWSKRRYLKGMYETKI